MVVVRVWRFRPDPRSITGFELVYGPAGDWARLFASSPGFLGTTLLKGAGSTEDYLTIDRWRSSGDWEVFRADYAAEYQALDQRCESLTTAELEIGSFEELPAQGPSSRAR
jgi:heme-degrading monooxygenase HmoA